MSIIEKQLKKLIEEASDESLKSGKVLDLSSIARIITEKLSRLSGGPTLNVRRQNRREKITLEMLNEMYKEVNFDIGLLYELIQEKFALILNRYNSIDVSYKAQRAQLNAIDAAVTDLLFTVKDADDNFFGVFDNLSDNAKVDLIATTKGALDLSEGVALLPYSMPSATRHDLSHMYNVSDGRVTSSAIDGSPVNSKNGTGSKVGDAFSDITTSWRRDVISTSQNGVQITLTFPLNKSDEPTRLTRIELGGIGGSGTEVDLRHSLDNENYTQFENGQPKVVLSNTEKIAWDFPETTVRYIRLILTKSAPDSRLKQGGTNTVSTNPALANSPTTPKQGGSDKGSAFGIKKSVAEDKWIYSFIISTISAYRLGRSQDAIFQTKPLLSTDAPISVINKLSLTVDEDIAPRTAIDYEIALSDSTGALATDFLPINPSNRIDALAPKVLEFGDQTLDSYSFTVNTGDVSTGDIVTSRAIDYYPIYQLPVDNDYRYGSAKLYRGGGVFSKAANSREVIKSVSDAYIDFSDGIRTKHFYSFTTETASVINRLIGAGNVLKTFLRLSGPVARSVRVVRDANSDPSSGVDPEPDYAVAKVEHIRSRMAIQNDPITPTGTNVIVNGVNVPVAGSWMGSTTSTSSIGVPILRNGHPIDVKPSTVTLKFISSTTQLEHTFQNGVDYTIKRSDDTFFQNFPGWQSQPLHWRVIPVEPSTIIVQSGSPLTGQYGNTGTFNVSFGQLPPVTLGSDTLASNETLKVSYEIDPDITHRVVDVSYASNEVELDGLVEMSPGDTILTTYRKVPQDIIRDSVRVTSNPGTSNPGTVFSEGKDYSLDITNGTMTIAAGGAINALPSPVVYVDFSFKQAVVETQTYSIWCYFDSREPLKFAYSNLNLRTGSGEQIYWTIDGNTKRIDDKNEFVLTRGWHQFVVRSLDPDKFNDAAVIKVLKFRDVEGRYLFLRKDRGGKIFQKVTAYRNAMSQTTFSNLKNSVLKTNHDRFAINSTNQVMVNFRPAETSELYMYRINSSGTIEGQTKEEFTIEATRRLVSSVSSSNPGYIILRARLSRADDSSGGVTPKLSGYNIRIAY